MPSNLRREFLGTPAGTPMDGLCSVAATPNVSPNTTYARLSTDPVHIIGRELNFNHTRLRISRHGFSKQGHSLYNTSLVFRKGE
jgi:hypothetical protein